MIENLRDKQIDKQPYAQDWNDMLLSFDPGHKIFKAKFCFDLMLI